MYDRTHSRYYSPAGHLIRGLSLFLMAFAFVSTNLGLVLMAFFIMGIGSALFQSPNNTEVMVALPREKAGVASSMSATLRNLGMALGVSVGTILLTLQMGAVNISDINGGAGSSDLASAVGRHHGGQRDHQRRRGGALPEGQLDGTRQMMRSMPVIAGRGQPYLPWDMRTGSNSSFASLLA